MSGRTLRSACVAATASLALLAATPLPLAAADPNKTARSPVPADPAAEPATGAQAAPADSSVTELLGELKTRYRQAEEAAEAFNAAETELRARQEEEERLSTDLVTARNALSAGRDTAGRLARAQYQGGTSAFSPYVRFLLTGDLQRAGEERQMMRREASRRAAALARLTAAEKRADHLATEARKALDTRQQLTEERQRRRDEAQARLRRVEELLASLTADQLARLATREEADADQAQRALLDSGRLGAPGAAATRTPSAAGGEAVDYAVEQLGKPYVWGAEGPGSFDCSGLTSQAWAHAGRAIPRTSQEQWARLERVPLEELRPGDLVLYFPEATHVALYLGGGMVVHAPRPGARVKVSPIAANPLLGAVRPDPTGAPLTRYAPPSLTEAATAGSDSGYASASAPSEAVTSAR
ncbi:NlpC/P60 family protein [Streptomyces sp. NPDC006879]|uniref:C40 family peptidase n=1 Tax=Streptomyces sp. NPDC006879 TaxID=3364767 RepID=UPI0036A09757